MKLLFLAVSAILLGVTVSWNKPIQIIMKLRYAKIHNKLAGSYYDQAPKWDKYLAQAAKSQCEGYIGKTCEELADMEDVGCLERMEEMGKAGTLFSKYLAPLHKDIALKVKFKLHCILLYRTYNSYFGGGATSPMCTCSCPD